MKRTKFTKQRKSTKGQHFVADYIDYEQAMIKANSILWEGKRPIIGFYVIFSINTGLRVSDVLSVKHSQLLNKKAGDYLRLTEKKTKKYREIILNGKIIDAYSSLIKRIGIFNPDNFVFLSQKGSVYKTSTLNPILKQVFKGYAEHISTHSLRKSFGRHVYNCNKQSEDALVKLSELFNHTSTKTTRIYLGLRREELGNIYMNL